MTAFKARDVRRSLTKKGFVERDNGDLFYTLWVGGKKSRIFTKMSKSDDDLGKRYLGTMTHQLKLGRSEFDRLITCTLEHEGYVALLRERGYL